MEFVLTMIYRTHIPVLPLIPTQTLMRHHPRRLLQETALLCHLLGVVRVLPALPEPMAANIAVKEMVVAPHVARLMRLRYVD